MPSPRTGDTVPNSVRRPDNVAACSYVPLNVVGSFILQFLARVPQTEGPSATQKKGRAARPPTHCRRTDSLQCWLNGRKEAEGGREADSLTQEGGGGSVDRRQLSL